MKCIYLAGNLDSMCAAAVIRSKFKDCEIVPINSQVAIDVESILPDEIIYLLGCSLPLSVMDEISSKAQLIWYDNRQEALAIQEDLNAEQVGVRKINLNVGTCQMAWDEHFPGTPYPEALDAIALCSVGRGGEVANYIEFDKGIRLFPCEPSDDDFWNEVFDYGGTAFADYSGLGDILTRAQAHRESMVCSLGGFYTELDGIRCVALNVIDAGPSTFDSIYDEDEHDIMLAFGFVHGAWKVSLFSKKEDFSAKVIAEKHKGYPGGGSDYFAYFLCRQFPFEFPLGAIPGEDVSGEA